MAKRAVLRTKLSWKKEFQRYWAAYLMFLLPLTILIVFKYIPMYGAQIAFRNYKPTLGVLAIAQGLSGLPMQKYSTGATALRIVTRVMLVAGGLLFVNPTLLTDAAALALIAAEVVIDRAVLPKVQRRMPLKAAAGANRSH